MTSLPPSLMRFIKYTEFPLGDPDSLTHTHMNTQICCSQNISWSSQVSEHTDWHTHMLYEKQPDCVFSASRRPFFCYLIVICYLCLCGSKRRRSEITVYADSTNQNSLTLGCVSLFYAFACVQVRCLDRVQIYLVPMYHCLFFFLSLSDMPCLYRHTAYRIWASV